MPKNVPTVEQYLTKNNLHDSFWGKKIIAAVKRDRFTDSNIDHAHTWNTCACGKISTKIEYSDETTFDSNGEPVESKKPLDFHLQNLGDEFYEHVRENRFRLAAETLVEIECRAKDLASQPVN